MNNKTIELHTIATFQGKEYEIENLLNGLLNKLEEKDKEIERLNNIIDELEKWLKKSIDDGTVIEEYGDYSTGCAYYYEEVLDKLKELKEGK